MNTHRTTGDWRSTEHWADLELAEAIRTISGRDGLYNDLARAVFNGRIRGERAEMALIARGSIPVCRIGSAKRRMLASVLRANESIEFVRKPWSSAMEELAEALRSVGREIPPGYVPDLERVPYEERDEQGLPWFRTVLVPKPPTKGKKP